MLKHFHSRIVEKNASMGAAPVLIVALGDSVTHGIMELGVIDQRATYHHQLWNVLIERYPGCVFSVINAGVGGDNAPAGMNRIERDVLRHQPDLVLIGYGLNDATGGGVAGVDAFKEAMGALVKRVRSQTQADVILLTPNFMNTRDNDRIAPAHRASAGLVERFVRIQNGGVLALYAQAIREVGASLDPAVPVADVFAEWEKLAARGVDTTAMLTNGLNHPDATGHRLATDAILRLIEAGKV